MIESGVGELRLQVVVDVEESLKLPSFIWSHLAELFTS
jgi:hypothetical protein